MATALIGLAFSAPPTPREPAGLQFSEKKSYDLGSLLELGLATNPATRAAWFQSQAASASIGEARAPYFPRIAASFEGGSDQWYTPAANAPDNFRRVQATTMLSLEFLLLDFGRRTADVDRAIAIFEASGLLYERKLQQVAFEIQQTYFAHEAAIRRQEAARSLVDAARTSAETVKKEVKAGLSSAPDWLAARKNLLDAEYELEASHSLVRTTLGNLCVAAGLPANSPLRLSKSELPASTSTLREKSEKLIGEALAARPDLAARAADVRAREAATKRARSDFFPEVRLEGKYAYSAFGYGAQAGTTSGSYQEGLNGYGAFLVAKWDLFDGFERVEKLRRKKAEEQASREDLARAKLETTRDVWTTYQDHLSAASRVDYAEGFVASAQENFEASKAAYSTGLATVSEFSQAASQLALARSTRATSVADYSTSLAALVLAVGSPPISEGSKSGRIEKQKR